MPYGDTDLGNIGSQNDLLLNGTKPLPEPMLTSYQWLSTGGIHLSNVTADAQAIILYFEFENYIFRITATTPRDQCVN